MVAGLLAAGACGSDDEELEIYQPRICGQEGPLMLVPMDESLSGFISFDELPGRVVVRRFGVETQGDVRTAQFETDIVGLCGEEPVKLSTALWPIRIRETLFACDVLDGTVYPVNPRTASLGEPLVGTFECEPQSRDEDYVVLVQRNVEGGSIAVLDSSGQVEHLDLPYSIPDDDLDRLAPFLNNPLQVNIKTRILSGTLLVQSDDQNLWSWDSETGLRQVASSVADFRLDGLTNAVVVASVTEVEPGLSSTLVLDLASGEVTAAPSVEELRVSSGYLFVPGGLYDLATRATHPYPNRVLGSDSVAVDPFQLANAVVGDRIIVWEIESGTVLLDEQAPGHRCSFGGTRAGAALEVTWAADETCVDSFRERYEFGPERVPRLPPGTTNEDLEVSPWQRRFRESSVGGLTDLVYLHVPTGQRVLIDTEVTSLTGGVGFALGRPTWSMLAYRVADGDRSGIWRSEFPDL